MPTTRLLTHLVTTASAISGGAVLTLEGKTGTTAEGLEAVDDLFALLASTLARDTPPTREQREEIVAFLKRATRRYGTVQHAVNAVAEERRPHPLIATDKAKAWANVMSVIPSAVEGTLRRHPSLKTRVSSWLSDQGSSMEARLKAYQHWLDAPFPDFEDEPPVLTDAATVSAHDAPVAVGDFDASDEQALELLRTVVADKRPGLHPDDRRPTNEEVALRESHRDSSNAFARLCVALSTAQIKEAERLLKQHAKKLSEDLLHTLRGEVAYIAARFDDACSHYRRALAHCHKPECAINLALALDRATEGSASERSREAIDTLCAMRDRISEDDPTRPRVHVCIGGAWLHNPVGDRDANVSLAIEALESALGVIERDEDPHWWAEAHLQLGIAWQARPSGRRAENIQRAITCFTRAEEIWTRDAHPEHWASIRNNLGHAWESLPTGHRTINMQRAIDYFNDALEVRQQSDSPVAVATIRNNLGNAWIKFPTGDHEENVRKGIEHHTAALEVWSAQNRRHEWAATQNNLGNAWALMPAWDEEEREKNLRRAISCYKSALDVRTKASTPAEWAATQNNLGSALVLLGDEHRAKPVREAIECFSRALEVRTKAAHPVEWAKTQNNLGRAWEKLAEGDPVRNLDKATEHFNNALNVFTEDAYPHHHNHTRASLKQARDRMSRLGYG